MKLTCLVTGALECNNYLLINEDFGQAVLIDCGDDAQKIFTALRTANIQLMGILLTHGHADHIATAEQVATYFSCPIYIHVDDEVLLKRALYNLSIQVLRRVLTIEIKARLLHDGDCFKIAGFEFEVIHTPGHTNGSVCFRTGDLLFTGDTLFKESVGGNFPPFGDLNKEIQSIRSRLFSLKEDLICYPGHGDKTSLEYEKKNNLYCGI